MSLEESRQVSAIIEAKVIARWELFLGSNNVLDMIYHEQTINRTDGAWELEQLNWPIERSVDVTEVAKNVSNWNS